MNEIDYNYPSNIKLENNKNIKGGNSKTKEIIDENKNLIIKNIYDLQNKARIKLEKINENLKSKKEKKNMSKLNIKKRLYYKKIYDFFNKELNFIPNQIYLVNNKLPYNFFHNIYIYYYLKKIFENVDYIIYGGKYWNQIEQLYQEIKKEDIQFNELLYNNEKPIYEKRLIYQIVYTTLFLLIFISSYTIYYILSSTLNLPPPTGTVLSKSFIDVL